ncbi:MAG: tetratricopeptide repeat protein, partial [Ardenticatenaceae bacterium]
MYLKGAERRNKANWRLRNWLMLALIYAITGLLWLRQERPLALIELAVTPSVAATVAVVNDTAMELLARGDLYFDQGNLTAALESYQEAVASDPNLAIAYARWGQLLALRHKTEEALIRTARAVELAPDDPEALAAHAMALEWSGDIPEAIRYADRAITMNPTYAAAHS